LRDGLPRERLLAFIKTCPAFLRQLGHRAGRVAIDTSPAVEACRRLGLPDDYPGREGSRR
jgi:hypothetical protein